MSKTKGCNNDAKYVLLAVSPWSNALRCKSKHPKLGERCVRKTGHATGSGSSKGHALRILLGFAPGTRHMKVYVDEDDVAIEKDADRLSEIIKAVRKAAR